MSCEEEPGANAPFSHESHECHETVCEPCSESGSLLKAEGYCVKCKEFMCQTCIQYHKRMKLLKDHQIQGPDEMPRTKSSCEAEVDHLPYQDVSTAECKVHNKEIIEFYCKDHTTVCCAVCLTLSHASCANILQVADVSIDEAVTNELDRYSQRLNAVSEGFRDLLQTAENDHLKVKDRKEKLLLNINMYKESAIETINRLANTLEMIVQKKTLVNQTQIDRRIKHCNTLLNYSEIISKELRGLQNSNQKAKEFILMKQSEHQLKVLETNVCDMNANPQFINYVFCPDFKLRWTLTKAEELGQLLEETVADTCDGCKNSASCRHLACEHNICRVCMNDSKNDILTCAVCGKISGSQPGGSLRKLLEEYKGRNFIKAEFDFPSGKQKSFHPRPGKKYEGRTLTCYLPDNDEGRKMFGMLKTAFSQRLISKIENDKVTANFELCQYVWSAGKQWASYSESLTESFGKLGITA